MNIPDAGATPRKTSWFQQRPVLRFLLGFGALLAVYYAVILLPWCDRALYVYLRVNAWLSNGILVAFGQQTRVNETTIRAADFAISVRRGCDAIEPAWFFCAAVIAFPVPWVRKFQALAFGTIAILMLNLVRIVSLFFIGQRWPRFFPTAHLELWPSVFILFAVTLWLTWLRGAMKLEPRAHG